MIIGRLIPAGTGVEQNRGLIVTNPVEEERKATAELEIVVSAEDTKEEFADQLAG